MRQPNRFNVRVLVIMGYLCLQAISNARACAVCYGEPNHPMTQGVEFAMITMLGVTYTVLLGILAVFFRFFILSKRKTQE